MGIPGSWRGSSSRSAASQPAPQPEETFQDLTVAVCEELLAVVVVRGALVGLRQRRVDVDSRREGLYGDVAVLEDGRDVS